MTWIKNKCLHRKFQVLMQNKGSVVLEAAICLPIFIIFLVVLILTQYARMADMMWQTALYKTSQEMRLYYIAADQSIGLVKTNEKVQEALAEIPPPLLNLLKSSSVQKINNEFILQRARYWFSKDVSHSKVLSKLITKIDLGTSYNPSEKVIWIKSEIEIPLLFYTYKRHQVVPVSLWSGEGNGIEVSDEDLGEDEGDNFWSWHNFKRGNYLREEFGGNLPPSYPVIASYSNGEAKMIKSIDLTAPTWQNHEVLTQEVQKWIRQLERFKGTKEPWGKEGIFIQPGDIRHRKILIVIPENSPPESLAVLETSVIEAGEKGIEIQIEQKEASQRFN